MWDPGREERSMSTMGDPLVVLPSTAVPVEPWIINTPRVILDPVKVLWSMCALGQRRRLIPWAPLFAHTLFSKMIDGESDGASLLPLWSPVAIKHCASTLRHWLPEITTWKVGGLLSS